MNRQFQFYDSPIKSRGGYSHVMRNEQFQFYDSPIKRIGMRLFLKK